MLLLRYTDNWVPGFWKKFMKLVFVMNLGKRISHANDKWNYPFIMMTKFLMKV